MREVIDELAARGIVFVVARPRASFEDQLTSLGLGDVIPEPHRFTTVRAAVEAVAGVDPQTLIACRVGNVVSSTGGLSLHPLGMRRRGLLVPNTQVSSRTGSTSRGRCCGEG